MTALNLHDYAQNIALFEPFSPPPARLSAEEKETVVKALLKDLKHITNTFKAFETGSYQNKRRLLHAALNVLPPHSLNDKAVATLDALLQTELHEGHIINSSHLAQSATLQIQGTKVLLWQGDITTLQIDAIVNAANNRLLGCFQPLHNCIDNAIHTKAGVQLRDDCFAIMQKQAAPEPTGTAKVTRAYNLPSNFVIHTVGPIVTEPLSTHHAKALQKSYLSCLDVCASIPQINSIAFCCISTGVFGYPQEQAAKTAFNTVCDWLNKTPKQLDYVVFNVFTDRDKEIYQALIKE